MKMYFVATKTAAFAFFSVTKVPNGLIRPKKLGFYEEKHSFFLVV